MGNVDLDDIEEVVKAISANDGILLCNWNYLIYGKCSCDFCPLDFDTFSCLSDDLFEGLK